MAPGPHSWGVGLIDPSARRLEISRKRERSMFRVEAIFGALLWLVDVVLAVVCGHYIYAGLSVLAAVVGAQIMLRFWG